MKNLLVNYLAAWHRIKRKLNILLLEKEYSNILSGKKKMYEWKSQNESEYSDEGITLSHFKNKSYLLNVKLGDTIETQVLTHKAWDEELLCLMSHFIDKNPSGVVLDIGANIGAITIPLANLYTDTKFYCFEPHPEIFKRLNKNIDLNRLINVIPCQVAVSADAGSLEFFAQTSYSNMGLSSFMDVKGSNVKKITVECIVADEFIKMHSIHNVSLVKIDVQGLEYLVLKGMSALVKTHRPILVFEHEDLLHLENGEEIKTWIKDFMIENNYDMYCANSSLISFSFYPQVDLSSKFNGNIIAIPNKEHANI